MSTDSSAKEERTPYQALEASTQCGDIAITGLKYGQDVTNVQFPERPSYSFKEKMKHYWEYLKGSPAMAPNRLKSAASSIDTPQSIRGELISNTWICNVRKTISVEEKNEMSDTVKMHSIVEKWRFTRGNSNAHRGILQRSIGAVWQDIGEWTVSKKMGEPVVLTISTQLRIQVQDQVQFCATGIGLSATTEAPHSQQMTMIRSGGTAKKTTEEEIIIESLACYRFTVNTSAGIGENRFRITLPSSKLSTYCDSDSDAESDYESNVSTTQKKDRTAIGAKQQQQQQQPVGVSVADAKTDAAKKKQNLLLDKGIDSWTLNREEVSSFMDVRIDASELSGSWLGVNCYCCCIPLACSYRQLSAPSKDALALIKGCWCWFGLIPCCLGHNAIVYRVPNTNRFMSRAFIRYKDYWGKNGAKGELHYDNADYGEDFFYNTNSSSRSCSSCCCCLHGAICGQRKNINVTDTIFDWINYSLHLKLCC